MAIFELRNRNMLQKLKNHRELLSYALSMAMLMVLLRWLEFRFLILEHQFEIYVGLIAVLFLLFGIWIANKILKPKEKIIIIEKEIRVTSSDNFIFN